MATQRIKTQMPTKIQAPSLEDFSESVALLLRSTGVTVSQFSASLRRHAIFLEAERYKPEKPNKSRIAFATGVPRSSVARVLANKTERSVNAIDLLVSTWCSNPQFMDDDRTPSTLPIFGSKKSLDHLARLSGKGIPVRAILDELTERGIVRNVGGQQVRLNAMKTHSLDSLSFTKQIKAISQIVRAAAHQTDSRHATPDLSAQTRTNLKRRG